MGLLAEWQNGPWTAPGVTGGRGGGAPLHTTTTTTPMRGPMQTQAQTQNTTDSSSTSSLSSPYSTKPSQIGSAFSAAASHSPTGTPSGISSASFQTGASSLGLNSNAPPFLALGSEKKEVREDLPLLHGVKNPKASETSGEIDFSALILNEGNEYDGGGGLFDFSNVTGDVGRKEEGGGVKFAFSSAGPEERAAVGQQTSAGGGNVNGSAVIGQTGGATQGMGYRSFGAPHNTLCDAAISEEIHSSSSDRW